MSQCLVLRPVSAVSTLLDQIENKVGNVALARVKAIEDAWFDRAVRRPRLGRVLDRVVDSGSALSSIMFIAVPAFMIVVSAVCWFIPYVGIVIRFDPEVSWMAVPEFLLGELLWFTPLMLVLLAVGKIFDGIELGCKEFRLRYMQAQAAEWAQRHPSGGYWTASWRYSRD